MRKSTRLLIIAVTIFTSSLAFAQRGQGYGFHRGSGYGMRRGGGGFGPCGGPGFKGRGFGMIPLWALKDAGISEAKQDKIRKIMFNAFEEKAQIRIKIRRLKWEIREKLMKADISGLLALEKKVAKLKSEAYLIRATARTKVLTLFSKSELKKLTELRNQRRGSGPGFRKRGRRKR